jgi:hypothetical protein
VTELEKLKHLLTHWIEHNDAHVINYSEWASKVDSLGEKELAVILNRIADESKRLNDLFNQALQSIK